MRRIQISLALLACLFWALDRAEAGSLRVAPTTLSLTAPGSASVLSLTNDDSAAINVQLRVFRWTQVNGVDRLEPTRDVVASPPAMTLKGGAATVVRIVRVSKSPVLGEESYRVIVDELPNPARRDSGNVALMLRYSVPIFFVSPEAEASEVAWSVRRVGDVNHLIASNSGERHIRISELAVRDDRGRTAVLSAGLAGYVLGGSTMSWPLAGHARTLSGSSVTVTAKSATGQINALAAR